MEINDYITKAENYIRAHPDTTGTTNAMIALTLSIQQVEARAKELNEAIDNSSENTKKHNRVIAWLTGALIFFTAIQAYAVWSATYNSRDAFHDRVEQTIFDECFNYYANLNPESGIDNSLIQICKDKATNWIKEN